VRRHPITARARRSVRGMTLIEAMVAITILAIVTTLVYGGFAQTMRNKGRVEEQSDRAHVLRVSMERMVRELSMAFVSVHTNPNPQLNSILTCFHAYREGRGSRIDFTSFSHRRLYRDAHESDQNELSYFLARHPEERDQTVLARRESRRIDADPEHGGQVTILVEDVRGFQLEFLDSITLDWVDSWDAAPNGTQANRLPAQVRITLEVPGIVRRDSNERYVTRAVIPITYALNHAVYQ
jgi:general secretion pathway protein J